MTVLSFVTVNRPEAASPKKNFSSINRTLGARLINVLNFKFFWFSIKDLKVLALPLTF